MDTLAILQQTPIHKVVSRTQIPVGGVECYIKGQSPGGDRNTSGKLEEAAYHFDQFLGLNLVPPTTSRIVNGQCYSIQEYRDIPTAHNASSTPDLLRLLDVALLDSLIANDDRHMGNWLIYDDEVVCIDHAYGFRNHDYNLFLDASFCKKVRRVVSTQPTLTLEHRALCLKVCQNIPALHTRLGHLLPTEALHALPRRAALMLRTNTYLWGQAW